VIIHFLPKNLIHFQRHFSYFDTESNIDTELNNLLYVDKANHWVRGHHSAVGVWSRFDDSRVHSRGGRLCCGREIVFVTESRGARNFQTNLFRLVVGVPVCVVCVCVRVLCVRVVCVVCACECVRVCVCLCCVNPNDFRQENVQVVDCAGSVELCLFNVFAPPHRTPTNDHTHTRTHTHEHMNTHKIHTHTQIHTQQRHAHTHTKHTRTHKYR